MTYAVPIKENERFRKHGILFLPLTDILENELELESVIGLSGKTISFWGKGGFQRKRIVVSSLQHSPLKNCIVVKNLKGLIKFKNYYPFSPVLNNSYEYLLGKTYVGTTLIGIYRTFR